MMQIGEVARALGVTTRTIRHYESLGLIQPHSTSESGYRLYTEREVVMLDHILVLRKLGFPLQEIKRLLDRLNEAEMPESEQVRALIRRQMQVIEREISHLEEVRSALGKSIFPWG
ncbi:MAG: MerR family transcriptional regulator [Syntrophothermus sp.]